VKENDTKSIVLLKKKKKSHPLIRVTDLVASLKKMQQKGSSPRMETKAI